MKLVIHYISAQGVILIQSVEYPYGRASNRELQSFAHVHLDKLDKLDLQTKTAIKEANIYILATTTTFNWE